MPHYWLPGLPGDRWYVTAVNRLRAHREGCAAPVVLASTYVTVVAPGRAMSSDLPYGGFRDVGPCDRTGGRLDKPEVAVGVDAEEVTGGHPRVVTGEHPT
jgi:hypothetical protein